MTSYGPQPKPGWPASGPAPSAQPAPADNGGQRDEPGMRPARQTGPHAVWHTAEGEPWPDWPAAGWLGRAADSERRIPDQRQDAGQGAAGQADQDWQSGQAWPLQPLSSEPASGQWSAQLRRQALAAGDELTAQPAGSDERWAMISYLGIPFLAFLAPLFVYLIKYRSSRFARQHATQALNLCLTVILYSFCAVLVGGLLALDSLTAALVILVPVLAALWLVALCYLVLAGSAASRGEFYRIPGWLCATLVR